MKLCVKSLLIGIIAGLIIPFLLGRELTIRIIHDISPGIRKPMIK